MNVTTIGSIDQSTVTFVQQLIDEGLLSSAVYYLEIPSTNTLALEQLRAGEVHADDLPRLYLTDRQTAGRGRHGRTWISLVGTLAFSLVVRDTSELLPLTAGVAVAQAIEHLCAPLKTQLKWPNDVYLNGGKVAGILLEASPALQDHVVIGIGINVNQAPPLDPDVDALAALPVSVSEVANRAIDRMELLATVLGRIHDLRQEPAQEIVSEFKKRCVLTGNVIQFTESNQTFEGHCIGVTDEGELLVDNLGELKKLRAGEVRLLRVR